MANRTGTESKSRLTKRTLNRIEARACEIDAEAMQKILGEIGGAKISAGDIGHMWLQSYQIALVEELVADVKDIRSTKVS